MCDNKVFQSIPRNYGHKSIQMPCGSTSIYGNTLLCDECLMAQDRKYPQGWRHTPGDTCPHGNYVGDAGGPDYLCGKCEAGE